MFTMLLAPRRAMSGIPIDLCSKDDRAVRCLGTVLGSATGERVRRNTPVSGFTPSDLRSAYKTPKRGGNGALVAIIGAYDDPNAEANLAIYREFYGLPACTQANGCFLKVDSNGNVPSLSVDPKGCAGWAGELALDLDMVSAMCPDCRLFLLVEVDTGPDVSTVGAARVANPLLPFRDAVDTSIRLGAKAICNSYGAPATQDDPAFNRPGVLIAAAAGDRGFGAARAGRLLRSACRRRHDAKASSINY